MFQGCDIADASPVGTRQKPFFSLKNFAAERKHTALGNVAGLGHGYKCSPISPKLAQMSVVFEKNLLPYHAPDAS